MNGMSMHPRLSIRSDALLYVKAQRALLWLSCLLGTGVQQSTGVHTQRELPHLPKLQKASSDVSPIGMVQNRK